RVGFSGRGFLRRFVGGLGFGVFLVVFLVGHRQSAQSLPPECERKVRVGANSPSLCPTIDSEMNTGTCFLPSWTAIVWPTISGKIVEVRDQVLTICFLFASLSAEIRPIRRSCTHGPFLVDRPIAYLPPLRLPRRRSRTM